MSRASNENNMEKTQILWNEETKTSRMNEYGEN